MSVGGAALILMACGGDGASLDASLVDSNADAPSNRFANVEVIEGRLPTGDGTAALGFFGTDTTTTISSVDDGPCHIEQWMKGTATLVNAGTVIVHGSSGDLTLVPNGSNQYFATGSGLLYAAGEQLTMSASNGNAPLTAMVTFPSHLTVTNPTTLTSFSKSGFTATWSPTTGMVTVRISQYPQTGPENHIDCVFDGAGGTGTINSTSLSNLIVGTSAAIVIITEAKATSAMGYAITFGADFTALTAMASVTP